MKSEPSFKLPKKDSESYSSLALKFQPKHTSTPAGMKAPQSSWASVPKSTAAGPPADGSSREAMMQSMLREVLGTLMGAVGGAFGGPGPSHPVRALGYRTSVDDSSDVAVPPSETSPAVQEEEEMIHISDASSSSSDEEKILKVPKASKSSCGKTDDDVSSPQSPDPSLKPAAKRSRLSSPLPGPSDGSSVSMVDSPDPAALSSEGSTFFRSITGFSENTLKDIVQDEGSEDAEKFSKSRLRARLITTTAVQIYEKNASSDEDDNDDFLAIEEDGEYKLQHRSTLPSNWSLQPQILNVTHQDELPFIGKKDIVAVVGDKGELSPMAVHDRNKDKTFKTVTVQTKSGKKISALLSRAA